MTKMTFPSSQRKAPSVVGRQSKGSSGSCIIQYSSQMPAHLIVNRSTSISNVTKFIDKWVYKNPKGHLACIHNLFTSSVRLSCWCSTNDGQSHNHRQGSWEGSIGRFGHSGNQQGKRPHSLPLGDRGKQKLERLEQRRERQRKQQWRPSWFLCVVANNPSHNAWYLYFMNECCYRRRGWY